MKFTDVRTLESVLAEYGMSSGASTPTSQQKTGATAKANAKPTTTKAPAKVDKGSPTVTPGLDVKDAEPEKVEPTYTKSKAKDIEVDAEYHNDKGEVAGKVVSKVGNKPNPDKVVIQDPKGEYQLVDPDEEVQVLNASKLSKLSKSTASSFNIKKHSKKRLAKLKTNMKKLVRKFKLREQGPEPIFEINFNRKNVAKNALTSSIKCGFEAETVFQDVADRGSDDGDWLYEYNWYDIEDFIRDQSGSADVDTINEAYREWIYEKAYELEGEIVNDIVLDRKEDEDELNDFVEAMLDEDDIEEYKERFLADLEDQDKEEYEDWDFVAWGRQYTEEDREDEYIEWLEEKIRDSGEALETAVETAESDYDHDTWANDEYGSWSSCLAEHGIYLYDENGSGEGVGEVADILRNWAVDNSSFDDVEHGDYHSTGSGETYWRVETDSSIEADYGTGAEVISPVYETPQDMMEEMKSLFEWFKRENVETNTSTGLHVTMSWNGEPDAPMDDNGRREGEEVNPVKLAVLLGDKYLLSTFGRANNSYAKSQIKSLQQAAQDLKSDPDNIKSIKKIESIIGKGINRGKFSSINFKDMKDRESGSQLIEFRIGGGTDYHLNFNTVAKAVIRYAETLRAAYDDDMYKKDYVKALFKVINSLDEVDPKDVERVKDRFETELPIVDIIKDYFDKSIYIDSMDTVAVAVNSLQRYRQFSQPNADDEWKKSVADYEEHTGKKMDIEEVERREPMQGMMRPYKKAPSKQAPLYLKKAQENFALAVGQAGFDLSSNKSRTNPNAKSIGAFRKALADFELTYEKLDQLILQQEDRIQVARQAQSTPQQKLTTIQNGVNKLFKKDVVTLPAFLSGSESDKIVKGLWSATQSGALQDGEQNKKFFKALASATNVDEVTIAAAWDSVNKDEFKSFNRDMVKGSYNSTGINGDNSWFPVGGPVNAAGLKKLLTHLADYEEWNHPVKKGHNPAVSGDDSYTSNALSKMQIKLRKRFEEIQRMKDVQPAQHYDMLKVISKELSELVPAVQATDKMMTELDPSLKGVEPHSTSQDGLDYFGMNSYSAEKLTALARQLKDPRASDPFDDAEILQVQSQIQNYLHDVFERNHLAKAKYGADVFTKGNLPKLIKSRTDAVSKFINAVDKLGQELGFDSTGIDIDKKKQLPKKQKQFMKKHGDPSIAKIKGFTFGGDIMVDKDFASEINVIGERELISRLQQTNSIHSTSYKDILVMPWAHSSAMRNAIEVLNKPELHKDTWRWPVAEEMKQRFISKYGHDMETMYDKYVSYNEYNIKQMLQKRGVVFTDDLGDGREPNFAPLVTSSEAKGPDGEPFDLRSAQVWRMNNESVFNKFDNLPLEEQINIINKVNKSTIDKLYETIEAEQDMTALLTAYGTPGKKKKKSKKVKESVPDFKQVDTINRLMADHFPVGDLKKQMLAYQAIPVPAMLDHFRQLRVEAGDDACARNILQMFVGVLPDETKAKIRMTEWSKQHVKSLLEAKGIMGRVVGDRFQNGNDTLEFMGVTTYPQDREQFDDAAERDSFVADIEQQLNAQIQWSNSPNNGSLAFAIAELTDPALNDKPSYWGRYFKKAGADMMGKWSNSQVPAGWKLQKAGAMKLDIGIDPQHLIKDENLYNGVDEVISTVAKNSQGHEIQQELLNGLTSIKNGEHPVFEGQISNLPALRDYFGEIMGPVALMSGMVGGQAEEARQELMNGAAWSSYGVKWPQEMNFALVDSIFVGPDGTEVGISSKGGKGARASAKNIADAIAKASPELVQTYSYTVEILNIIQENSAAQGPFRLAEYLKVLPKGLEAEILTYAKEGKTDYEGLSTEAQELFNYGTPRQDVPGFNVGYALIALLAKKVAGKINESPEFGQGCLAFLNQSSIVQLYCKMGKQGENARVTGWEAVYPPNFQGTVVLDGSKNYYSSRIGGKFAFGFV